MIRQTNERWAGRLKINQNGITSAAHIDRLEWMFISMFNRQTHEPGAPETASNGCRAVLYARVSTKEQEQGYSIAAQKELLRNYGIQQGFIIDQEFMDVDSGWSTGRPGFEKTLAYLKAHGNCRVLLVEKVDRLCRNLFDGATIEGMSGMNVEIHFVKNGLVLSETSRASDRLVYGINVVQAKYHSDNLSEEVKKGMRTKAAQGLWPSYAPLGYLNAMGPNHQRIIVHDPALGPIITTLFGWCATAECSLKMLARRAYEEGFRFRSGKKVPVSTIHKILRNPIYMGEFVYGGVRYQGCHEPLVTRATWERVQEILDGRHRKRHRKVTHEFAYSGLVSCGHCHCSLVGERKKGKYVYYRCTGYRGKCGEPYTREEVLRQQFATCLADIKIPVAICQWLDVEMVEFYRKEEEARTQVLRRQRGELERARTRLDVLYNDRLDFRIDATIYDQKADAIRAQEQQLLESIQAIEAKPALSMEGSAALATRTNQIAELFLVQSAAEQRKLLHLVVSEASWKGGELQVVFREPFEILRLSKCSICGQPDLESGGERQ